MLELVLNEAREYGFPEGIISRFLSESDPSIEPIEILLPGRFKDCKEGSSRLGPIADDGGGWSAGGCLEFG